MGFNLDYNVTHVPSVLSGLSLSLVVVVVVVVVVMIIENKVWGGDTGTVTQSATDDRTKGNPRKRSRM